MAELIGAYVEITGRCNAGCPYCYNRALVPSENELSASLLKDLFFQLKQNGLTTAVLSGGEPFLHADIADILRDATDQGVSVLVISNGSCFSEKSLPVLLRFQPNLQITFDGWDAESHDTTRGKGNFRLLTEGILRARKAGFHSGLSVRLNIHQDNAPHLEDMLHMLEWVSTRCVSKDSCINDINLSLLHRTEDGDGRFHRYLPRTFFLQNDAFDDICSRWNESHITKITYDKSVDFGCAYNGETERVNCSFRIAPDGGVYPCQLFTDPRYCLGNIHRDSLRDILRGDRLSAFTKQVKSRTKRIPQCRSCGYQGFCFGGCPATALIDNGSMDSVSDICRFRKSALNDVFSKIMKKG